MSTNPNSLNNSQNFSKLYMRQNIIKKKTGMVYKKGEGPLDWNWNPRYFVLDCEKLMYYKNINDIYPRDTLFLEGSTVSDLQEMDEREHVFCIELANTERKIYVSCDDKAETQQWQKDIKSAAGYNSDQISDNRSEAITEERNQKFSSKNINNLFKMNEFPDFINSDLTHFLESFPNDLENNNIQKWHQLEYRNGQHIYKKTDPQKPSLITYEGQENNTTLQQNQSKSKNGPSLISFLIVKPKNSKNNKNHQNFEFDETSSKIIVPDNIDHIFSYLKKNSFKQKIDLYLVNYNKSESVTNLEKNTNFELQFNNQNIKAKIRKTRFINDQTYYIIYDYDYINEENNQKAKKKNFRPEEIQVKEIFILQKINENQTVIYLYQKLSSNFIDSFTLNNINLKRIQQLQVLREKIQYEVKKTMAIEQENQNLQQNQKRIRKAVQPGDSENPDLIMQIQLPEELKESFQEEQNKVKLLQSNQIPQGQEGLNLEKRKPGYKKLKDGRVHCFNKKEIDSQKGLIQELLAKVGQQLIEGKSIVGISLPVKIFEPRSTIERICDNWVYLPIYLGLAGQTTDPIERLKYVITFCMSGLYNSIKQQKPFNPILGETFQGFFSDGTSIDIEHTSHHPPISHYILQDPQKTFKFTGYYEYKAKLTYTGNSIIGRQQGPQTITFKDGQKITWELPSQKVNGFIIGDRTLEWMGTSLFKDHKSGYQCEIKFFESGFLTSAKHSTDHFEGNIVHESNPQKVISKAFGCWTEFVEFDGKRYWDIKYIEPSKVIKSQGPLDSDCRYRQDSIYLAKGDQKLSAEWKHKLEVLQRKDRAARIAYFNKTKV
ncbi:hypothetical protein PPERSA_09739 [Pseudocohnilembus persalinus]|uniref:PH domain-containing protein n=1 Tax=Pseudocohnilembus persalinus TaxID=266149 RepID=A0A0V0Q8U7_PSEPJ|nr:hypothetical protein PPERSA_09739 [Pseudocohnilembus persalinus]|eukprot:KRW98586.1 hypothetical protein PPERSA_09739 [Pseudocohnilembus persalinus]